MAVIRFVLDFDIDDWGRIGFVGEGPREGESFFLLAPEGQVLTEIPIDDGTASQIERGHLRWVGADRWVIAGGGRAVRAWWVDAGRSAITPIGGLDSAGIRAVAADHRGGFLICAPVFVEPARHDILGGEIISVDAAGKAHLLVPLSEEELRPPFSTGLAVTSDGEIVVLDLRGQSLIVFSAEGKYLRTLICGGDWTDLLRDEEISPDVGGRVVWYDLGNPSKIRRIWVREFRSPEPVPTEADAGPGLYPRIEVLPRYPDGKGFRCDGVRVASDGHLWVSDGEAIMRLNDEGVVDRILGGGAEADASH